MSTHRQREAKRARRLKRISGPSRASGHIRGPVARATAQAALADVGAGRVLAMVASTRGSTPLRARKREPILALVPTSYGTHCRPEILDDLEARRAERDEPGDLVA